MTQPITGYRTLSDEEITTINSVKATGVDVALLIENLKKTDADPRWIAIASTQLQQGFMALTRAVAKPQGF